MSKNAKKPTLNDILDLAIELARRHSDASPELAAALREYDADLQCAWKKTAPMLPAKEEAAVGRGDDAAAQIGLPPAPR